MINLLILIPVHGREEVRRVAFDALLQQDSAARAIGIKPYVWHVESAWSGETLGAKLNRGLSNALVGSPWDYMMVLGSDDLLRPQIWGYIRAAIEEELPFFGFNKAYLYDRINHRAKVWDAGAGTFGAGRCIRRDLVEACDWSIWDGEKNNGIDGSQERIVFARTREPIHILHTHLPVVCDIKDGENLNSYDDVKNCIEVQPSHVRKLFPALEAWPIPRPMWTATATSDPIGGGSDL